MIFHRASGVRRLRSFAHSGGPPERISPEKGLGRVCGLDYNQNDTATAKRARQQTTGEFFFAPIRCACDVEDPAAGPR